jgi:hypothetical protein
MRPGLEKALAALGPMFCSNASQSSGPCAGPAARGNIGRLQGYDLCRNEAQGRGKAQSLHPWRLKCRAVAASLEEAGDSLFYLYMVSKKPMEIDPDLECNRAIA